MLTFIVETQESILIIDGFRDDIWRAYFTGERWLVTSFGHLNTIWI